MIHWSQAAYDEQQRRLAHALEHADLVIDTDSLSIKEVFERVIAFIEKTVS
jgi:cytidylate kinase